MGRVKVWGQKAAWAKSFFEMISHDSGSALADPKASEKSRAKSLKAIELDPRTAWRCKRCGWMDEGDAAPAISHSTTSQAETRRPGALPRDPITGRPMFSRLADHLEHSSGEGQGAVGLSAPPPCKAGQLVYVKGESIESACPLPQATASTSASSPDDSAGPREVQTRATGKEVVPSQASVELLREFIYSPSAQTRLVDPSRLIILIENPKTPRNIGSILRALGCFGYASTPSSPNAEGAHRRDKGFSAGDKSNQCLVLFTGIRLLKAFEYNPLSTLTTDTQKMRQHIRLHWLKEEALLWRVLDESPRESKTSPSPPRGAHVVAVDLIAGAVPLPMFVHPFLEPAESSSPGVVVYIFGPEDGTLSQHSLSRSHSAVYIPTVGSLNLSAAVTVLLYDRVSKLLSHAKGAAAGRTNLSSEIQNDQESDEESSKAKRGRNAEGSPLVGLHQCLEELGSAFIQRRNVNNHLVWDH